MLIILLSLLAACTANNNQAGEDSSHESYTFTYQDHTFDVVPFYDEVLQYIQDMKEDKVNNENVYEENVLEPLTANLEVKSVYDFFDTTTEFKQLKQKTKELIDQKDKHNDMIEEAFKASADKLPPNKDITVYLFPVNPEDDFTMNKMNGITGVTLSGGDILIKMDPSLPDDQFKRTMTHEYHHTAIGGDVETIVDRIIAEGKASTFANMIYPDVSVDRTKPLSSQEKEHWSNYRMGYQIMESYLKQHPDESVADWTEKGPEAIVKESDYHSIAD